MTDAHFLIFSVYLSLFLKYRVDKCRSYKREILLEKNDPLWLITAQILSEPFSLLQCSNYTTKEKVIA